MPVLGSWLCSAFGVGLLLLIAGAPLDADLATAAWKEAVTYAHRVVGWTMGAAIVISAGLAKTTSWKPTERRARNHRRANVVPKHFSRPSAVRTEAANSVRRAWRGARG